MKYIPRLLDDTELELLRNLPEVARGQSMFYAELPESIRQKLQEQLGVTTPCRLPFRRMYGDTAPHVDVGSRAFENTHLVYLTDGEGRFQIGEDSYPIEAGSGFVFAEGTQHKVTQTNGTSRLLLGPMSEQGSAVGFGGTSVSADGATDTVYVEQIGEDYFYKINQGDLTLLVFPLVVSNTNVSPASNILKVLFTSNLTFTSDAGYVQTNSDGIQIGGTSVRNDGTKTTITIDGVANYGGFVSNLFNNIYVYNIHVAAINESTLAGGGGWIGRYQYGRDKTNNFIIGCSSDGPITNYSGGIVGGEAATTGDAETSDLTIVGCTSSGAIDSYGGGIAGEYAGSGTGANMYILKCSSSGTIGSEGGGITAVYAGEGSGSCQTDKCYSTGTIGTSAGGIFGANAGDAGQAVASNCYSRGTIGTDSGAIFGANAGSTEGTAIASNCYGIGSGGEEGIFGTGASGGTSSSSCYIANVSWSDSAAIAAGLDLTIYISTGINTPYELRNIGPSPYSLTTIGDEDMSLSFSGTVAAGSSSIAYVLAGLSSFSIVEIDNESPAEIPTITINSTTGVISTTSATPVGTYNIIVRAVINPYSITTFTLTITESTPTSSTQGTIDVKGKRYDFSIYNDVQEGQRFVIERIERPNLRFNSFADYNKYIMAQASFRR